MRVQIYKPNKTSSGCAFTFQIGFRDGLPEFYVNAVQQASWNAQARTGSFKENAKDPNKSLNAKLGEFELGEILNSFEKNIPWSQFHTFADNKTTFLFAPWTKSKDVITGTGKEAVQVDAFGIAVTRNGSNKFRVALEPGEIRAVSQLINYYFKLLFDKRAAKDALYRKNASVKQVSTPTPEKSEVPADNESDPPF